MFYIALRFRFSFGVGAMIASLHDVLITLVAAHVRRLRLVVERRRRLLTLIGYGVNDQIVIFDRVRENLRTSRREPIDAVINKSVNQTLPRTVITAGATVLSVLSLYLFGGEVLRGFAFTMLVGIITSTYSTVFIASAIAVLLSPKPHTATKAAGAATARPAVAPKPSLDLLIAAILGIVQGLTEFLPVSSSGHLILARAFFGWDLGRFGIPFDAACHVGHALAVVAYFRADIERLVMAIPGALRFGDGEWERLVRLIVVGTVPIVIVGALFEDVIESRLRTPLIVAVNLVIGGIGLIWVERVARQDRQASSLGLGEAFAIGVAQAAALAPGLSRSGSTIIVSMFLGIRRDSAARFVFLMSLPAIAAVAVREVAKLADIGLAGIPISIFAVGLVSSAVVGYFTVKYFMRYLAGHSLAAFAYYRFALAAVTVVWLLTR